VVCIESYCVIRNVVNCVESSCILKNMWFVWRVLVS
jgi:hypothetical protein